MLWPQPVTSPIGIAIAYKESHDGRRGDQPRQLKTLDPRGASETLDQTDQRGDHSHRDQSDEGERQRQDRPEPLEAQGILKAGDGSILENSRTEDDPEEHQHQPTAQDSGEPSPTERRKMAAREQEEQERDRRDHDGHPHRRLDGRENSPEVAAP